MTTPISNAAQDVTETVLDSMLNEALNLTDEIAAVGAVSRAIGAPDSFDCALRLRLAARLSRVAAWASLRASADPERLAIADAALQGAAASHNDDDHSLDEARSASELAPFTGLVDRIVERAIRLDSLLAGHSAPVILCEELPQSEEGSATILPFRRPATVDVAAEMEQVSEAP